MSAQVFAVTLFLALVCVNLANGQSVPSLAGQNLSSNKYAKQVKDCFLKDKTQLENCLLQFWKGIIPLAKTGVPELKIPKLDPLFLDNIFFDERRPSVSATALFTGINVVGAAGLTPKTIKVDTKAKTVTVTLSFPFLNVTGQYKINGTIMFLNIDGNGKFVMNLAGIDATATSHIVQKGTGVTTSSVGLDFTIKNIYVKLFGLLGGDEVGTAVNNMLNDNSQQILEDIKPAIAKKLSDVFLNITKDAFVDLPPNAFIA